MGLDNFASRTVEEIMLTEADLQAFSDASIDLYGGLYSGDPGSFHGEMYDLLLLDITGVSPLQTWIPPEIVRVMYKALVSCDPGTMLNKYLQDYEDREEEYRGPSLEELTTNILELRKFFRVCAERCTNFGKPTSPTSMIKQHPGKRQIFYALISLLPGSSGYETSREGNYHLINPSV